MQAGAPVIRNMFHFRSANFRQEKSILLTVASQKSPCKMKIGLVEKFEYLPDSRTIGAGCARAYCRTGAGVLCFARASP